MRPDYGSLSEAQLRYLRRVADQMMECACTEITIKLQDGGVRDYRESRGLKPTDLEESDNGLLRNMAG